jgi:hypothetical protein
MYSAADGCVSVQEEIPSREWLGEKCQNEKPHTIELNRCSCFLSALTFFTFFAASEYSVKKIVLNRVGTKLDEELPLLFRIWERYPYLTDVSLRMSYDASPVAAEPFKMLNKVQWLELMMVKIENLESFCKILKSFSHLKVLRLVGRLSFGAREMTALCDVLNTIPIRTLSLNCNNIDNSLNILQDGLSGNRRLRHLNLGAIVLSKDELEELKKQIWETNGCLELLIDRESEWKIERNVAARRKAEDVVVFLQLCFQSKDRGDFSVLPGNVLLYVLLPMVAASIGEICWCDEIV